MLWKRNRFLGNFLHFPHFPFLSLALSEIQTEHKRTTRKHLFLLFSSDFPATKRNVKLKIFQLNQQIQTNNQQSQKTYAADDGERRAGFRFDFDFRFGFGGNRERLGASFDGKQDSVKSSCLASFFGGKSDVLVTVSVASTGFGGKSPFSLSSIRNYKCGERETKPWITFELKKFKSWERAKNAGFRRMWRRKTHRLGGIRRTTALRRDDGRGGWR